MRESLWQEIRHLHDQGLSRRAISRRLAIHRRTVRQALKSERPPKAVSRRRGSIVDPHRGWLLAKLEQFPELTAARLFHLLKERGYEGGVSLVREVVAELRPRLKPVYQNLYFAPGECAQVDWGAWQMLDVEGGQRRISFFCMVLCHSRMLFAEFFLGEKMEHWLQAQRHAFEFFGGVPRKVMVDNCKTAVLRARSHSEPVQINPDYQAFADHYGFAIVACDPYQPQQKGRIENAVGYLKGAFLAGRPTAPPEVLNPAVRHWLDTQANSRIHGTTGRQPQQAFLDEEKAALAPLPGSPHPGTVVSSVCVNSVCRISVDTNRYSVGPQFASRRLILHADAQRLRLFTPENTFVCEHLRSYGRNLQICDPQHVRELADRNHRRHDEIHVKAFLTLGCAAQTYLQGLREKRPDYPNHIRKINSLAQIHGVEAVARALMDAGEHQAFSADHIENLITARNRPLVQPGPLHVTRNRDLLELEIPQPNLDIYNTNKESQP